MNTSSYKQKNSILYSIGAILFFILFTTCKKESTTAIGDANVVFKVNNTSVTTEEYDLFLQDQKALTYNYFFKKYKAKNSPTFWTTTIEGETPINYIKTKTNTQLTSIKVVQDYASNIDLVPQFNFETFITDWKAENNRRKIKKNAGEVIFGPIETSKKEYYDYLQSNLEIRLKDKLNTTRFKPSKEQLEALYRSFKNTHFTYNDTIRVAYLNFPYNTSTERKERLKQAQSIYGKLNKQKPHLALDSYKKNEFYHTKEFYDAVKLYGEENPEKDLKAYASNLKFGVLQFIDTKLETNSSVYILTLLAPHVQATRPFDSVRKDLSYMYKAQKYKQLMDSLSNNVSIIFNKPVYENITITL